MAVYVPLRTQTVRETLLGRGHLRLARTTCEAGGWSEIKAVLQPAPGRSVQLGGACRAVLRATKAADTARSTPPAPPVPARRSERIPERAGSRRGTCERRRAGRRSPAAPKRDIASPARRRDRRIDR